MSESAAAVSLRPVASNDFPELSRWYRDDGPDWPWLERFASDPLARAWVVDTGQLAGVIWFRVLADEAELIDLRVAEAVRGQGLGRRLLACGLQALRDEGVAVCHLEVRVSNTVAQHLYSVAGFIETGRRRDYYRSAKGREDAILMSCQLSGGENAS